MISSILSQFPIDGELIKAERFGMGLINDTYLCEFRKNNVLHKFISQRINHLVFNNPEKVMNNVEIVTSHIVKRLHKQGIVNPHAMTPALLHARDGKSFYRDFTGSYWRVYYFIESGIAYDTVRDEQHAYEIGRGLGKFQNLVSDLEPHKLDIIIPNFHHTPYYLVEYDKALKADIKIRASSIEKESKFVFHRKFLAPVLTKLIQSREIPIRVVHNDPKVNNIMVHVLTRKALCMLDLDTAMPGIVHFDFGDCARSVVNRAGETTRDLEKVSVDMSLFEALVSGYFCEAGSFLTKREIETLHFALKTITFELGVRFLTDYLRGDVYFKTQYQLHNLDRARVQFKLLESIEAVDRKVEALIAHLGFKTRI